MKNEVLLQKRSSSFSNYWATSLNDAEIQLKKLCTHNNGNLYAYAANNPVKYTDPDGNTVYPIVSFYSMSNYSAIKTPSGSLLSIEGCAITLDANVAFSAGATDINPISICINDSNFNSCGNLLWNKPLPPNVSTTGAENTPLTVEKFNELNNESSFYFVGIKVQYSGSSKHPSNSPHWVGVNSIYTDKKGNKYFVISPTSNNDSVLGNKTTGNNRGGLGWKNIDGIGIVVPVERTTDYIKFKIEEM